jgi:hopene-associated glycosyltransferase HpnB
VPALVAASLLAAAAWVYLLAAHGQYWRTDQRLPPVPGQAPGEWPAVVAVVPARNEAAILPETLPTLLAQDYAGTFRVILVDDDSSDGTARIAAGLGGTAGRLQVVSARPAPPGWAGKVWAMSEGLRAAGEARYVLFTDADIGYAPRSLAELVAAAEARGCALLSQMALLRTRAFWERLLIPAFVYFFAQLYPFRRVNGARSGAAAAAGGCMLARRAALAEAGGLEPIKGARIDDVALAGLLKRSGHECWLGFTAEVVSRRKYGTLGEIWAMVARSAYTQLRHSPAALAATVIGLAWLYLLPVAATVAGLALLADGSAAPGPDHRAAAWLAAAGLAAWAVMSVTYLPVLRLNRLSAARAPSLPLVAAAYAAMTMSSAWRHHRGRGVPWKGRV